MDTQYNFHLKQQNSNFKIYINNMNEAIYETILLKSNHHEVTVPIINQEACITSVHLMEWFTHNSQATIFVYLTYLFPVEDRKDELEDIYVMIDHQLYEKRRRLIKPHRMHLLVEGLQPFSLADDTIYPYFNNNGIFVFAKNQSIPRKAYYMNRQLTKIKIADKQFKLQGKLSLRNLEMTSLELELHSRNTGNKTIVAVPFDLVNRMKSKMHIKFDYIYKIDAIAQIREMMLNVRDDEDVWDLFWIIKQQGKNDELRIRCGMPRIIVEQLMRGEINLTEGENIHNAVPYLTVKGRNLSFFYNKYTLEEFSAYKKVVKAGKRKSSNNMKPVWIVGERPYKAQDNGLRFFEYLRSHHPEIDAYYVIRQDSAELENVSACGNIVYYKSAQHFELMAKADFICGTHHPDFLYPNRSKKFTKILHAKQIFLQHGVLGVKNITEFYSKKIKDFNTDLFITSSEREKEIVMKDMGYESYEVAVTGLPRFKRLFDGEIPVKKQILIIPSWRDWLTNEELFLQSDYYERYSSLLNNERLLALKEQGVDILFCLHPNMQRFTHLFTIPKEITIILQGERIVQDLLKESALLITDYSSVAFDFSFLHKPVIYYQFDRSRFLGKYPSHLDIDKTLPGYISSLEDEVVDEVWSSYSSNFEMTDHYKELANSFISQRDDQSNERIFEAIMAIPTSIPKLDQLKNNTLYTIATKKIRKTKYYFPLMKKFYTVASATMKKNPKLILFESNVGKQIADSPKAIYDELIAQNADYEYVWVHNGKTILNNSQTKIIKRLSPEYFYYLAKSSYWINNQNFPSYLKKKKNQQYIQTWHGTPLKKMQNDVQHFAGKDEGYLKRVNQSVKQWDYLVSPSPYASSAFKSAFLFKKEILEVGYPRNDIFYADLAKQQAIITEVKEKYRIDKTKKIVLYAPTFRDDDVNDKRKHEISLKLDLDQLYAALGDGYIILIRAHLIIANKLVIPKEYRDFAINVSKYPDIQHLYLAADICMTDYSSVMFDFAHTKKPLLFFTYDLEHYRENLRGFYIDFEKQAPGPLLLSNDDIIEALVNIEDVTNRYKEKYAAFYEAYCSKENGTAAKQIVQRFFVNKTTA
ncbi:CDP-glycerol glycerophosphotransferase family protein [Kurthia sibirica]|uniref:CDP-glycerol--glycerophosphate glycerophosphotransferase n=1 Tax=Kurthia sibirica TaxID=202750 RepID=A0A2U3ANE1_9BACL|nr:CDP-glycerol glycerophosphotransferase family protein [Kurthia sibirica]PWI26048.1 CDP-glycerol--glycerophosphate glycerophosphotransferase [Kurthia sibirica]GEK34802.1 hypothetical protein KSI01_23350 [Kurthia sibirica]